MKTEIVVAEQQKAQQALRESEQRYKRLLAATTDYIYSVNLTNGHAGVTSHGPGCESVTGYSQREFAEDPYLWYRLIYEGDRPGVMAQVDRILHDQPVGPLEHRIVRKDGQVRWVRNTTIPHRNEQGRLIGYDGLISDVTHRKLAEIALRESQERLARKGEVLRRLVRQLNASRRELRNTQERFIQTAKLELAGTLAAGVAHEVKNPLQTIIMGLHLLSQKLPEQQHTAEIKLALEEMSTAVFRAKSIISDLLTLAHPMEFKRQVEDLHSVIGSSVRLLKNELLKAKVTVETQFDPALPLASVDPQRLEQVFLNLLLNAIQAMPKGGAITIRTSTQRVAEWEASRQSLFRNFKSGDQVALVTIRDRAQAFPKNCYPGFSIRSSPPSHLESAPGWACRWPRKLSNSMVVRSN